MSKQVKIQVLSKAHGRGRLFGTCSPFLDTTEGRIYDALLMEAGEADPEGDVVDKQAVVFTDDVGDLAAAHVDFHEGLSFQFVDDGI